MDLVEIARQQRKTAALSLFRLNRELMAISSCRKTLLRAEDEQTLLSDICRIICDEAGYRLAWAGYVEHDPAQSIRIVASAGVDEGYLEQAKLTWADTARGRGPTGRAVRTGKIACFQDIQADPLAEPWRESALQRGYRSTITLPLKDHDAMVFGVLNIYSIYPDNFTPDEIRLLQDLADDLVFGILVLRTRKANELAKQRIALQGFALNSVHEAAYMVDERGRLQYANDELCRLLGYTHDELLQLSLPEIDPDSPQESWHAHWLELKRNRPITLEGRLLTRDGSVLPVEVTNSYFAYAGLELNLALLRDITERKKVEQERQANFHYFKSMDQINRAIQRADDLDRMMQEVLNLVLSIFACDRAYLLHPCDPDADVWTVPMECCRPDFPDLYTLGQPILMTAEMAESFRTSLRADGPAQFGPGTGNPLPPKAAERFAARNVMSMVLRPKVGKPWRFGILQCTSLKNWAPEDERLFEAIGRRLSDSLDSLLTLKELEQRVQQRTSELQMSNAELKNTYRGLQTAHARLLQQEKMAAIGQLAAGIAHEINTPAQFVGGNISFLRESFENLLNAMELCRDLLNTTEEHQPVGTIQQTFDQTLAEADLDFMKEEVFQSLKECQEGVDRIARTVGALKDFAHTGGSSLQLVELAPLIDSTVEVTRNQWMKVARLETDLDPELPTVYGIRNELAIALLNLVVNATHAIGDEPQTGQNQGIIRIVTRHNGNWAEILVQDNGCGIPEELQQKIFDPFFTTREVGKGSGQGLAIAYNIISGNHHGELLVDSEKGKGTTFTIRLPIAAPTSDAPTVCQWPK